MGEVTGTVVLTVAEMIILQEIEDALQRVVNVIGVEKSVILKWSVGEGHTKTFQQWERPGINSRARKVESKVSDSGKKRKANDIDDEIEWGQMWVQVTKVDTFWPSSDTVG